MRRNRIVVLFFLVSLLSASCSKVDKLFLNGEPVTEQRATGGHFGVLCMYNNVNVKLVQSDHPHLELTCPKNLIGNIVTEVRNDSLIIRNDNEYNWLRTYDYDINLTVYYDSLREITYASIGRLECPEPLVGYLHATDSIVGSYSSNFILRIKEGSGDININFDCQVMKLVFSNGTSKVTLRGEAGYVEYYLKSYGAVHAETLNSNIVKVMSHSTNDIYVWARSQLIAQLFSIGNVYYKGNPNIEEHCEGDGRVIKLE